VCSNAACLLGSRGTKMTFAQFSRNFRGDDLFFG